MLRHLLTLTFRDPLGYTLIGGLGLTVDLACTGLVAAVSAQSLSAARVDPARVLRSE
jgi:hypothetical protein